MSLKAIITVGISCSGKTTFAESLDRTWVNVNRDDLRFTLTGTKGWGEYKFNKATEEMVTQMQESIVIHARSQGKNVIISDTNINPETLNKWLNILNDMDYFVDVKHFPVDLNTAWKRDSLRLNGVGHDVIYGQWLRYNELYGYTYTPNPKLPSAAIFDIDGTLAKMVNREPFDWYKVDQDIVRYPVKGMLETFENDKHIILLSGRDSCCEDLTRQWLDDHVIPYDFLYMRSEGDTRPDTEIKLELFKEHIEPNYYVDLVVDDRPCMIRMWNSIKIPMVISVADPYIEF